VGQSFLPLILTVAFAAAQAQDKPNLTGTWMMNPARSDFGHGPAPTFRLDRITHNEPTLKDTITQRNERGEVTYDMTYSTDGKECTNYPNGNEFKARAHWEGTELVIESQGTLKRAVTLKDRYALSSDGKTLIIWRHASALLGSTDQKIVFEKQ
jgi:hypothetical protein